MPFVKLDTGILYSTLWFERDARELFITALLMAEPREITESIPQLMVESLELTGFVVPPGWYGFVRAAGIGIIRQAGMDRGEGMKALQELGNPDIESRSSDYEGRRLVRVDGGFVVLNFVKYRDRDQTTVDRSRRWRQRQKELREQHRDNITQRRDDGVTQRDSSRGVTIAEAEAEAEALKATPKTKAARFTRPSLSELSEYVRERKSPIDPQGFMDFYESKGWRVGNQPMKDWRAAVRTWERRETHAAKKKGGAGILTVNGADLKRKAAQRLGEK